MTLLILDIPDRREDLATWLDRQVVDPQLHQLVAELAFVAKDYNPAGFKPNTLSQLLGKDRHAVLSEGLSRLSYERVAAFLAVPDLLLDLQEDVLIHGGSYWQELFESSQPDIPRKQVEPNQATEADAPVQVLKPVSSRKQGGMMMLVLAGSLLAVVAMLAVQFQGFNNDPVNHVVEQDPDRSGNETANGTEQTQMVASTWGWDSPDAFDNTLSEDEYLNQLADAADAWFKKRPQDAQALQLRLAQFRHGCQTLLEAPHTALKAEEQTWLRDHCRNWASQIDDMLAQLNDNNYQDVLKQADQTINKLKSTIRLKADELV